MKSQRIGFYRVNEQLLSKPSTYLIAQSYQGRLMITLIYLLQFEKYLQ